MRTFAVLLTAVLLSISAAQSADTPRAEGKRAGAKQTQKSITPAQRFASTRRYIAENAAKTAQIIKINAAKLKESVWPQQQRKSAADKVRKDETDAGKNP